jgi:hypothetical protein
MTAEEAAKLPSFWVQLKDDIPAFGCGWRLVTVKRLGWKWVTLTSSSSVTSHRMKRAEFDALLPYAREVLCNGQEE